MSEKLIELSTIKLLAKFGAGNHKPGSGSAAAFQGLLSTQLIRTLIDLTKDKPNYRQWLTKLREIEVKIDDRIYPSLLELFQLDSEQFDHVIKLRKSRDSERNLEKKRELKRAIDEAMRPATETPISIGKLCIELAEFAVFLFDHGFQTARGDSGVALNNAVAAIAGCLSIINLNLLSLGHDEQIERYRNDAEFLKGQHAKLTSEARFRLNTLENEAKRNMDYHKELQALTSGRWVDANISYKEIEQLARRLQNTLWLYNDKLTKQDQPEYLVDILKPEIVLTKILKYQYHESSSLGQHFVGDGIFEIAGIIDKSTKMVTVSKQFPKETRNFTAAHELGHALLHKQLVLHRDKALDGSIIGNTRDIIELEADKFATFFLMPTKQVRSIFKELFSTEKFVVNTDSVFQLTASGTEEFRRRYKSLRDLTRFLASTESFGGRKFKSMANIFNVSITTMAIRLEELELVAY